MWSPQRDDWKLLKRMARYPRPRPRMLLRFKHQEPPSHLTVTVDADFAGRRRTRKSTNGGYIMRGCHMIKSWPTAQTVVAMSSGESEYHGLVKGGCEDIGVSGSVLLRILEHGCFQRGGDLVAGAEVIDGSFFAYVFFESSSGLPGPRCYGIGRCKAFSVYIYNIVCVYFRIYFSHHAILLFIDLCP